jgi:signal transduction histidine kinase
MGGRVGFKVAARTILELGAELISTDAIALYELIKNSYDAGSKRATLDIHTVLKFSELRNFRQRLAAAQRLVQDEGADEDELVDKLRAQLVDRMDPTAAQAALDAFQAALAEVDDLDELGEAVETQFEALNYIDVIDTGEGMSLRDLREIFLTVGTTSRLHDTGGRHFVGGKGIGRLSAMRLGDRLRVETARESDSVWNLLTIDWRNFTHESADTLDTIDVAPRRGPPKEQVDAHGTTIRVQALKADWDFERVKRLADRYFDRLFDPFSGRSRYPLVIRVNGAKVPVPTFDRDVLEEAQASVSIRYIVSPEPQLTLDINYITRGRPKVEVWSRDDILGITAHEDVSVAALESLGPFRADFHWFNRQRLKAIEGYGDREKVKDTVNNWANGLLMYRDGFRVNPYGNPDDDWLGLDAKALGSGGYKVNRKQIIGAVYISAEDNPALIDQTNREGLRANEEKSLLVLLLRKAITENFKTFLNDVEKELRKSTRIDATETAAYLDQISKRVARSLKTLHSLVPRENEEEVEFLEETFDELQGRLADAKASIANAEKDQRDLVDLAGVGLQVEIVAHELGRVTRRTLDLIKTLQGVDLPPRAQSTFGSIESQMLVIRKRLDVLDPLGPSSRNAKAKTDLKELVEQVFDAHVDQFGRYGIGHELRVYPRSTRSFTKRVVRGMIVQVLENLIDNAVFWLRQRSRADPDFEPRIEIEIDVDDDEIRVTDNGPGIPVDRREEIFKPFVSFKPPGEGKGLGLFISREIARRHSSDLYLQEGADTTGRLHTFVLDMAGS